MEAQFYDNEGQVWFRFKKPSIADTNAQPFEFEGPATERHIRDYSPAFAEFLKNKRRAEKETPLSERNRRGHPFKSKEDLVARALRDTGQPPSARVGTLTDLHDLGRDGTDPRDPTRVGTLTDPARVGVDPRDPARVGTDSHNVTRVGTDPHNVARDRVGTDPARVGTDSGRVGADSRDPARVGTDSHNVTRVGADSRDPIRAGTDSHDTGRVGTDFHEGTVRDPVTRIPTK